MHLRRLALLPAAALLLAACASSGATPAWTLGPTLAPASPGASGGEGAASPTAAASPSAAPSPSAARSPSAAPSPSAAASGSPGTSGSATRIEVKLTDQLKMDPATISVPAGVPVTFVVTNTGTIQHQFFVGDAAAQTAEEQAMTGATSAPPDSANGIGVNPGQTRELTVTFSAPGTSLAGCHIAGHYLAGMKSTITITFKDANTKVMSLKGNMDGKEFEMVEITYKRRAK